MNKFPDLLQGKEIHDPGFGIFAVYGKTAEQLKGNKRFNYEEKMKQYNEISAIIRKAAAKRQNRFRFGEWGSYHLRAEYVVRGGV